MQNNPFDIKPEAAVAVSLDELVPVEQVTQLEEQLEPEPLVENTEVEEVVEEEIPEDKKTEKTELRYTNSRVTVVDKIKTKLDESNEQRPISFNPSTLSEMTAIVNNPLYQKEENGLPKEWHVAYSNGSQLIHTNTAFQEALDSQVNEWTQFIQHGEKRIAPYRPIWKTPDGNTLVGLRAIDRIRATLNQGSTISIPCWASGVWLTLKAPTALDLADNFDLIANEIIELGKQTGGGIFDNTQVYLNKNLMGLVEKLFYSWNLDESNSAERKDLSDVLLVNDLEVIAWAIGVCMYPNGYPFEEPCVADIETCTAVSKQLINLNKILFVNNAKLTNWQKEFMSNPTAKHTYEEILKYRSETFGATKSYPVADYDFKVYLKIPTINEYIENGYNWISQLKDSIRNIIVNVNDNKLNTMLFERAGLTLARSYSHYITAIEFNDGKVINTREDVDKSINELCSVPEASESLMKSVREFIRDTTVSLVALPRHKCPACGNNPKEPPDEEHPYLIPVSALNLFFNLRDRKIDYA